MRVRLPRKKVSKKLRTYVKSAITRKAEHKYVDLQLNVTAVSTTMQQFLMNGLTQGTNVNNRIANEVKILYADVCYQWQLPSAGDQTNYCRAMIVRDKQPNGAAFSASDLLAFSTDPLSWTNEDNKARFKFYHDRSYDLSLTGPCAVHFRRRVKLDFTTYFTGSTNTIAQIKSNSMYFCVISDSGAVTHPNIDANIRIWWTDA